MKTDSDVILYFGKYKGKRLGEVPTSYLGWLYASFTYGERLVEPELRRRGLADIELNDFRRRHPWLAKKPMAVREGGRGK